MSLSCSKMLHQKAQQHSPCGLRSSVNAQSRGKLCATDNLSAFLKGPVTRRMTCLSACKIQWSGLHVPNSLSCLALVWPSCVYNIPTAFCPPARSPRKIGKQQIESKTATEVHMWEPSSKRPKQRSMSLDLPRLDEHTAVGDVCTIKF